MRSTAHRAKYIPIPFIIQQHTNVHLIIMMNWICRGLFHMYFMRMIIPAITMKADNVHHADSFIMYSCTDNMYTHLHNVYKSGGMFLLILHGLLPGPFLDLPNANMENIQSIWSSISNDQIIHVLKQVFLVQEAFDFR